MRPSPQYAVILTDQNVVEVVAMCKKVDWNLDHVVQRLKRVAHRGETLILFAKFDASGHITAMTDTPYRDHLHAKIRLSTTDTHGHFMKIEEI